MGVLVGCASAVAVCPAIAVPTIAVFTSGIAASIVAVYATAVSATAVSATAVCGTAVSATAVPAIAVCATAVPTIAVFTVVSILYIAAGGVKAVVWTNVFQAGLFLVAGGATLVFLLAQIDGGAATVARVAGEAGRLSLVNWGPAPGDANFWRHVFIDPNIVWFEPQGLADGASSVDAVDMDGDGDLDVIATASAANIVVWFERDGANPPNFTPRIVANGAIGASMAKAADIDRDGDQDIVSASSGDGTIRWHENSGALGFVSAPLSRKSSRLENTSRRGFRRIK